MSQVWSLSASAEITDEQFSRWCRLLEERTGIQFGDSQRALLQSQIFIRMRELNLDSYDSYFDWVTEGLQGLIEWSTLVDRLVVKETQFFRHRDSIEFLRGHLQQRIDAKTLADNFELWSVGCSTGEEPYSLAMAVNDCFELALLEPYYGITATDISVSALGIAKQGSYNPRKLEHVRPEEVTRYFHGKSDGNYQVVSKLRDRICFSQGNLLKIAQMPKVPMDVIFCQNMLIYFRKWRRREILNGFVERLKPGGILLIGLGEIVDWEHPQLIRADDDRVQAYIRR